MIPSFTESFYLTFALFLGFVFSDFFFLFFSFYDGVNRKKEMQVGEAFKFHGENWGKGNAIHHAFFWFCSIFVYIDFVFLKH